MHRFLINRFDEVNEFNLIYMITLGLDLNLD